MMRILACAVLVLLALVPVDLAHNAANQPGDVNVIANPPHVDFDRRASNGASVNRNGVSGRYVTSGDGLSVAGLTPITVGDVILFPSGGFAVSHGGALLCDLEVLGDGSGGLSDQLLDEFWVDNSRAGLVVPDGLWDDGGIGGACHTSHYINADYNAPGCPSGAHANAEDAVSGAGVWIGAGCDTMRTGPGGTPDLLVFALCLGQAITQGADPAVLVGCVSTFISCTAPGNDCTVPAPPVCGQDNVVDVVAFGRGQGHAPHDANTVIYPTSLSCPASGGTASVLVFTSVQATAVPIGIILAPATTGWIDQD